MSEHAVGWLVGLVYLVVGMPLKVRAYKRSPVHVREGAEASTHGPQSVVQLPQVSSPLQAASPQKGHGPEQTSVCIRSVVQVPLPVAGATTMRLRETVPSQSAEQADQSDQRERTQSWSAVTLTAAVLQPVRWKASVAGAGSVEGEGGV